MKFSVVEDFRRVDLHLFLILRGILLDSGSRQERGIQIGG